MSSPITPIDGPSGRSDISPPPTTPPARSGPVDIAAFARELAGLHRGPGVQAANEGPPPEVLAQIAGAARIHQELRRNGEELRFSLEEGNRSVQVELHDRERGHSRSLSVVEALEIAAGRPNR
jgi:hypothetical protein